MAMNNWGGITEHMTKKSRKFFGRKIKVSTDSKNKLPNSVIVKANQKKRIKIIKEVLILIFIILIIVLGVFLYLK